MTATPAETWAVVVGIDTYAPTGATNPGPASDAARFADWLISRGVHRDRIIRLLSPAPASKAEVEKLVGRWTPAADDEVMSLLKGPLAGWHGDALVVYWAGHGMLRGEDTELFFADRGDLTLSVVRLRRYLLGLRQLPRQLVVIDACRIHEVHAGLPIPPEPESLPARDNQAVRDQALIYAVGEGERSPLISTGSTTAFGQDFRAAYESLPPDVWPPDASALRRWILEHGSTHPVLRDARGELTGRHRGRPVIPSRPPAAETNELIRRLLAVPEVNWSESLPRIDHALRAKWDFILPPPAVSRLTVPELVYHYWPHRDAPRHFVEVVQERPWDFPAGDPFVVDLLGFLTAAADRGRVR